MLQLPAVLISFSLLSLQSSRQLFLYSGYELESHRHFRIVRIASNHCRDAIVRGLFSY